MQSTFLLRVIIGAVALGVMDCYLKPIELPNGPQIVADFENDLMAAIKSNDSAKFLALHDPDFRYYGCNFKSDLATYAKAVNYGVGMTRNRTEKDYIVTSWFREIRYNVRVKRQTAPVNLEHKLRANYYDVWVLLYVAEDCIGYSS